MKQRAQYYWDCLWHWVGDRKFRIYTWWFWWAKGWPTKSRCPQCAGLGTYSSEVMARYDDEPDTCGMCQGRGIITRGT